VAAAALTATGHDGRVYTVSGPQALRPADRARILAEVTGRPPRTFRQWAQAHASAF
jgi:uncharacterized protein YbjT (DUF2867 family)